jgi:formylmethanofuran dehydrogenase subunit A
VPNVYAMGYRYAQMGYITVFEAAQAIMKARHTHKELGEMKSKPTRSIRQLSMQR